MQHYNSETSSPERRGFPSSEDAGDDGYQYNNDGSAVPRLNLPQDNERLPLKKRINNEYRNRNRNAQEDGEWINRVIEL